MAARKPSPSSKPRRSSQEGWQSQSRNVNPRESREAYRQAEQRGWSTSRYGDEPMAYRNRGRKEIAEEYDPYHRDITSRDWERERGSVSPYAPRRLSRPEDFEPEYYQQARRTGYAGWRDEANARYNEEDEEDFENAYYEPRGRFLAREEEEEEEEEEHEDDEDEDEDFEEGDEEEEEEQEEEEESRFRNRYYPSRDDFERRSYQPRQRRY